MNLKKYLSFFAWALLVPVVFSACDEDDNPAGGDDDQTAFRAEKGIYVFNAGNQGSGIDGSLSFIDLARGFKNDVFQLVNGRSLGSTVQDGVVLGDYMYIAVSGSNTIEVVDKHTVQSVAQILPAAAEGSQPRDIVTDGEYVYVSMFDGYVSRINPSTHEIDKTVKVGPNPEEMAVVGNCLYVVNSDGMNYANGYVDGKSVSKINLGDFTEEKRIEVGMNPTKLVAHTASGKLFVACMGDYAANPASLWTIDTATDTATDLQTPVTLMCLSGNTLYTIYNDWSGVDNMQYIAYDARTNAVTDEEFIPVLVSSQNPDFEYNRVDNPAGILVNPADGRIFITSYVDDPVNAYALPSYVYEYSAEGEAAARYDVGVGAVYMMLLE